MPASYVQNRRVFWSVLKTAWGLQLEFWRSERRAKQFSTTVWWSDTGTHQNSPLSRFCSASSDRSALLISDHSLELKTKILIALVTINISRKFRVIFDKNLVVCRLVCSILKELCDYHRSKEQFHDLWRLICTLSWCSQSVKLLNCSRLCSLWLLRLPCRDNCCDEQVWTSLLCGWIVLTSMTIKLLVGSHWRFREVSLSPVTKPLNKDSC